MSTGHLSIDASKQHRRYSSVDLAKSCNISVKEAEAVIACSQINYDENGTLDIKQFESLKQQIMQRSALFSNSFNTYYDSPSPNIHINNTNDNKQQSKIKYNIGSDHDINTINIHQSFDSDKASIDTNDIYQQEMEILVDNFTEICDKMEQFDHRQQQKQENKPYKMLLNGSPFGIKPDTNKQSRFGVNYNGNNVDGKYKVVPKYKVIPKYKVVPKRTAPKYKHNWSLGIKYDVKDDCVVINVTDSVTNGVWRKLITKQDVTDGDVKREYFKLGKLISNGTTSYSKPHKGSQNVQVCISTKNEIYNILVIPI